jgi:protein involved in polysaccharide export with SLBB domain
MSLYKNGGAAILKACPSLLRSAFLTFAAFLFVALLILSAFGQTSSPAKVDEASESNLIHYGDVIDVDVVGNLEYDWRGTVNPEGFLDGLTLGREPIFALCKSESEIAAEISKQYSRVLKDPKIVVKVLDRSGRAVTLLLGAVRNQQRLKIRREVRLVELLSLSGGITDTASGEITVFRPANLNCFAPRGRDEPASSKAMRFTITQLLKGDPDADPVILSGDIITIADASPIYVIGGVNTPRQISSRSEMSVSRAISAAGGISKEGNESDVNIYRHDGQDSRTLTVDLKKIRAKQQEDILLKPLDIVDVGQKGRTRSKYPPTVNSEAVSRDIFKLPVTVVE